MASALAERRGEDVAPLRPLSRQLHHRYVSIKYGRTFASFQKRSNTHILSNTYRLRSSLAILVRYTAFRIAYIKCVQCFPVPPLASPPKKFLPRLMRSSPPLPILERNNTDLIAILTPWQQDFIQFNIRLLNGKPQRWLL